MRKLLSIFFLIIAIHKAEAQQIPIGSWESLVPYGTSADVAVGDNTVYSGLYGLLKYDILNNSITTLTRVNGLSDAEITKLSYDELNEALVIVYRNFNIDLIKNGRVVNIPYLKNFITVVSKDVNSIKIKEGYAYLSTGIGIVILNLEKEEVKETYSLQQNGEQISCYDVFFNNGKIYTLTNKGIFSANETGSILQDINNWTKISDSVFAHAYANSSLVYLNTEKELYTWDYTNAVSKIHTTDLLYRKGSLHNNKFILPAFDGYGRAWIFENGIIEDSIVAINPLAIEATSNDYWIADIYNGLNRYSRTSNSINNIKPQSVFGINCHNVKNFHNQTWVCGGRVFGLFLATSARDGVSVLENNNWRYLNQYYEMPQFLDTFNDVLDVEKDLSTGHYFLSSHGGGIAEIDNDKKFVKLYKQGYLEPAYNNFVRTTSLKMDENNNLWASLCYANQNFVVKENDGSWTNFSLSTGPGDRVLGEIEIDNAGQKWVSTIGNGIVVFNDNNTIKNKLDDKQKRLTTGAGSGNLASNIVNCIVKDKDGALWVGTENGISIFYNPESVFDNSNFDAVNKIVQFNVIDSVANYLFVNEDVKTIAIDGANRKWIGTNNGVWLITADGEQQIHNFNTQNSPLPSNEIQKISINSITGVVYIATKENGIWAYRGTATAGAEEELELVTFPNPVPANYTGTIAIKNCSENAEVKIFDEAQQLIYKTKANGGQAVWSGKTYTGKKPHSGVYYIVTSNEDGTIKGKGKFVIVN